MFTSKISWGIRILLLLLLSLGATKMSVSAATFSTVSVNSGCTYPCSGYYTSHFDAKIQADSYSSSYYQTVQFRGTLTHDNQFGDQWGIMELKVYSSGTEVYQSTPGQLYTAANSSYWQKINASKLILKGNNREDFNFAYVLKNPNGTVAERWYPVRRATNI